MIADDDPTLVVELRRQALESAYVANSRSDARRRAATELREQAGALGDTRRAKQAKERERKEARREREPAEKRRTRLELLQGREAKLWSLVHQPIGTRQPNRYDQAVSLLQDLHDLAELQGDVGPFRRKMSALHEAHQRKAALLERLREANLLSG